MFSQLGYRFTADGANGRVLGNLGDEGGAYAEFEARLTEKPLRQETTDGRSTHGYFPYYRLETDEEKLTVVLSWQGHMVRGVFAGRRWRGDQHGAAECLHLF